MARLLVLLSERAVPEPGPQTVPGQRKPVMPGPQQAAAARQPVLVVAQRLAARTRSQTLRLARALELTRRCPGASPVRLLPPERVLASVS